MSQSTWECQACGREITKAKPGRGRPPLKCVEDGGTGILVQSTRTRKPVRKSVKATAPPARKSSKPSDRGTVIPPDDYDWDEEEETDDDEYDDEYEEETESEEDESEEEDDTFGEVSKRVKASNGFSESTKKANACARYLAENGWSGSRVKIPEQGRVELTATRDIEMLTAVWVNGELVQPIEYTMWSTDSSDPYKGNAKDLPFDPETAEDKEIVATINGAAIEWYNALAQSTEVATVKNGSVRIQHIYDAEGNESPMDRQITFTDRDSGFRTIRLAGLRRVGGSTRKQRSDKGQPRKPANEPPRKRTTKKTAPAKRTAPARRTTPIKRTGRQTRKSK